jgi:hypothetical protein
MKLERTIEQWRNCDPRAMAKQSEAAVMYAFTDAKADILKLASERTALRALLKELMQYTPHIERKAGVESGRYDPAGEALLAILDRCKEHCAEETTGHDPR